MVKDMSNVDISETVKDRNAIPSALKPIFGGLRNVHDRTWLRGKCNPLLISSVKKMLKDMSNVDVSEKVKDRNTIATALKLVSGGLQNAYNRTCLLGKCDPLSDF